MPYLYKCVHTKHKDFVTRTKCFYYNPSQSKKSRGIRLCQTGEGKQKRNKRNAYLKRKYEIYNNFDKGDLWITLTHREDIEPNVAHRLAMNVLSVTRKELKKKNKELQFVYYIKTEAGEKVRAHHHIFLKNNTPEILGLILKNWQKHGNVKDVKEIYDIESGKLITYFLDGGEHKDLNFEKYSHSRNLAQPKIETRVMPFDSFRAVPKAPKAKDGYRFEIVDLYNGFPDRDGYIYQEYAIRKIKEVMQE